MTTPQRLPRNLRRRAHTTKIHLRHNTVPTMAACGSGYTWASTIALTDELAEVTCADCLRVTGSSDTVMA